MLNEKEINLHKSRIELIPFIIDGIECQITLIKDEHQLLGFAPDSKQSNKILDSIHKLENAIKFWKTSEQKSYAFLKKQGFDLDREATTEEQEQMEDELKELLPQALKYNARGRIRRAWKILIHG